MKYLIIALAFALTAVAHETFAYDIYGGFSNADVDPTYRCNRRAPTIPASASAGIMSAGIVGIYGGFYNADLDTTYRCNPRAPVSPATATRSGGSTDIYGGFSNPDVDTTYRYR